MSPALTETHTLAASGTTTRALPSRCSKVCHVPTMSDVSGEANNMTLLGTVCNGSKHRVGSIELFSKSHQTNVNRLQGCFTDFPFPDGMVFE